MGDGRWEQNKRSLARSPDGAPRARDHPLLPGRQPAACLATTHSPSPRRSDVHLLIDQLTKSSTTTLQSYPITLAHWPNNHQSGPAAQLQISLAKVNRDLDQPRPTFPKAVDRGRSDYQIPFINLPTTTSPDRPSVIDRVNLYLAILKPHYGEIKVGPALVIPLEPGLT